MQIKAATLIKKNNVKILNLKVPALKAGEILVKIKYSSICHTQLQEIFGLRGKDKYLPHCLGHEATGIVVKLGVGIQKVKVKDKVCLTWIKGDGKQTSGVKYLTQKKIVNAGPVNTFSNFSVVSENRTIKLPKNSNLKKDVLMGCAIPTAFNAVFNTLKKATKDSIIIFGAGGLGLACIFAAKEAGFKKIYALDRDKNKLKVAKEFGATNSIHLSNIKKFDLVMKDYKNFFSNGLECSGNLKLMEKSINTIRNFGGKLIIIGNYPPSKKVNINPWNFIMGKNITGSWQHQLSYDKFFPLFYKKFKKFKYNSYFGKKIYTLANINQAIKDFSSGKVIRPLIKM